jgi:hypoxanthine phosphoribosyltransferase
VNPKPDVLFDADAIARRVAQIGTEIASTYDGKELCVVGIMKSCLVFMADLIRQIPMPTTCHFLRSTSVREEVAGSVRTDIVYSAEIPYEGRNILLLEGVVDTGITLNFLVDHIREREPQSLKVCALIDKPRDRKIDVHPDWAGFSIKDPLPRDGFIVGYGLDWADNYRGLPYLGTIPRPAPPPEGRTITLSQGR